MRVAIYGKAPNVAKFQGDGSGELVVLKVQVRAGEITHFLRDGAGQLVVAEVQFLQIGEVA